MDCTFAYNYKVPSFAYNYKVPSNENNENRNYHILYC